MGELTGPAGSTAALRRSYDAACKRVLSDRQVLARVMREWLPEFAGADLADIERDGFEGDPRTGEDAVGRDGPAGPAPLLSGEDVTLAEGTAVFDVRFTARVPAPGGGEGGAVVRVELDVEAQNVFRPGYPLMRRAVFYAGRLLSQQGSEVYPGSHYERVHKAATLWVCADPPRAYAGTVTSFGLEPLHVLGKAPFRAEEYDLVQVVMACLDRERPGSSPGALGMLEVLLSDSMAAGERLARLRDRYGMMITREIGEGVSDMCNLSEGVFQRGVDKGREEGREEGLKKGRREGREEGREEERAESLRSLMSTLGLTADAALAALRVPDDDRPRLLAQLAKG